MDRWEFDEERKRQERNSLAFSVLITIGYGAILYFVGLRYFISTALLIFFVGYMKRRAHLFRKWEEEILRTRDRKDFLQFVEEAQPEEKGYFSNSHIAMIVIAGALLLTISSWLLIRKSSLDEHYQTTVGKVIEKTEWYFKTHHAIIKIEYNVDGQKYTTTMNVDHVVGGKWYYISDTLCEVQLGDEFRIRYSSSDFSNSEAVGKLPINRRFP